MQLHSRIVVDAPVRLRAARAESAAPALSIETRAAAVNQTRATT
jgi:hypothetical protein